MSAYLPGIVWLVVLLAVNAFFVGAEFAVMSARRSQVEPKAEAGSRAAKTALWAMEHATLMLSACQLGITVCSLVILTVSEPAIHHLLEIPLGLTPLTATTVSVIAFVVTLTLVTYLHVVFGEMVPKNLSFSVPDRAVLILAPPLVFVSRLVRPVITMLNAIANVLVRAVGVEPKDEAASTFTLEEVAGIVERSRDEGTLTERSGALEGALAFTGRAVEEIVVPMPEIVTVPAGATLRDVHDAVRAHGFSRYPVAGDPVDHYVHVKDVMERGPEQYDDPVEDSHLRAMIRVTTEDGIEEALGRMRQAGCHAAVAVDESGSITGVAFMEDLLELLIGEINHPQDYKAGRVGQPG